MSTASPLGLSRLLALIPVHADDVKLPQVPKTRSAMVPAVRGVLYSSTRWLRSSATQRWPDPSALSPEGEHMLLALPPPLLHFFAVKLPFCPKTKSAIVS